MFESAIMAQVADYLVVLVAVVLVALSVARVSDTVRRVDDRRLMLQSLVQYVRLQVPPVNRMW